MQQQLSPLLTAPIPAMLRKIAIPVVIGTIFNTAYNIVDTIFAGWISEQALASLSITFPIFFILIAMGVGFGQGNTALIGRALGQGKQAEATHFAIQGLSFGIISGLLLTVVIQFLAPPLVSLMGATDPAYKQMTLSYLLPLFNAAIFFMSIQMLGSILNAKGNTTPLRNFLVTGFFFNFLLNYWFVNGGLGLPALGITGIAAATVLTQFAGCMYMSYQASQTDLLSLDSLKEHWLPKPSSQRQIIAQGILNTLDLMSVSIGFFFLTIYVSRFGSTAVAALGAASRLEQVFVLPMIGLSIGVIALVSQNLGATQLDRVQETLRVGVRYCIIIMTVTMVLAIVLARPMMLLFGNDPALIDIGVSYIRWRAIGFIPNAVFFVTAAAVRGAAKPFWPLIANLVRFVVLPLILLVIFIDLLGYGLTAIWAISTASLFIMMPVSTYIARMLLPRPATETVGSA